MELKPSPRRHQAMTAQSRPHLTLADLADAPKEWLDGFCNGSPTMRRHLAEYRHQRKERENAD